MNEQLMYINGHVHKFLSSVSSHTQVSSLPLQRSQQETYQQHLKFFVDQVYFVSFMSTLEAYVKEVCYFERSLLL